METSYSSGVCAPAAAPGAAAPPTPALPPLPAPPASGGDTSKLLVKVGSAGHSSGHYDVTVEGSSPHRGPGRGHRTAPFFIGVAGGTASGERRRLPACPPTRPPVRLPAFLPTYAAMFSP